MLSSKRKDLLQSYRDEPRRILHLGSWRQVSRRDIQFESPHRNMHAEVRTAACANQNASTRAIYNISQASIREVARRGEPPRLGEIAFEEKASFDTVSGRDAARE